MNNIVTSLLVPALVSILVSFLTITIRDKYIEFFSRGKDKYFIRKNGPKVIVQQLSSALDLSNSMYLIQVKADDKNCSKTKIDVLRVTKEKDLPKNMQTQYKLYTINSKHYDFGCTVKSVDINGVIYAITGDEFNGYIEGGTKVSFITNIGIGMRSITLDCQNHFVEFDATYMGVTRNDFPKKIVRKKN